MDKISVIIPVYNIASYLQRCLDSVISQTYKNLEIIVVNDGSLDNSLEILEEYAIRDERVVVLNKENGGVTSCRREGLANAQGKYIFFLDGDDWLESESLERLYLLGKEQDADIIVGNAYYSTDNEDIEMFSTNFDVLSSKEFIHSLAIGKQPWCLWMKLIKKSICYKMVIPDGLSMAEDMLGVLQLSFYARVIAKSNYHGYHYYQRQGCCNKNSNEKACDGCVIGRKVCIRFFKAKNAYSDYFDDIAIINLRCLLTCCNQGE
ncbi:MAG: glycosyltransferase family 2 protein [Butyricimonas faecalis]